MLKLNLKSSLLLTALAVSATRVAHSTEATRAEKDSLASSTGINRLQDVGNHEEQIEINNKAIIALDELKTKYKEFHKYVKELTSNPRDSELNTRTSIFDLERDNGAIFEKIVDFANTYNELSKFVQETTAEGADLYGCEFAHQVMNELKAKILVPVAGLAPTDYSFIPVITSNGKQFGLNFIHNAIENYSRIDIDLEKLLMTISNEPEKLEKLFSLQVEISDPQFKIWRVPQVLHASLGGETITATFMRDSAGALTRKFEVGGITNKAEMTDVEGGMYGPKGTIIEGLQVYHTDLASLPNGTSTWTTITITQGVAHLLEGVMDAKLDPCAITLPELNDRPQKFVDYFANEQENYMMNTRKLLEEANNGPFEFPKNDQ